MPEYDDKKKLDGEYLVINNLQDIKKSDDFFDALIKFQYGETAEESNKGFEQMKRISSEDSIEIKLNE